MLTNSEVEMTPRQSAIVAGIALLIMTILAPFANFFILQRLTVAGDAAETASNILAAEGMFRAGIFAFLIVAILDIVVAWGLYYLFKPVDKSLSMLGAWLRVAYCSHAGRGPGLPP